MPEDTRAVALAERANDAVRTFMEEMRTIANEARALDKDEQQAEIERLQRAVRHERKRKLAALKLKERLLKRLEQADPKAAEAFKGLETIHEQD